MRVNGPTHSVLSLGLLPLESQASVEATQEIGELAVCFCHSCGLQDRNCCADCSSCALNLCKLVHSLLWTELLEELVLSLRLAAYFNIISADV